MWKRFYIVALVLGALLSPTRAAHGCSDYGCDSWGGLYSLGDSNLYGFGLDMYGLGDFSGYGYEDYGYGGGCGSLLPTCSSGYDMAGLYGSDWGIGGDAGISLDISISLGGIDTSGYSYMNPYQDGYDIGCGIGICNGGYQPYYTDNFPPSTPWYNPIDIPYSPGYFPYDYPQIPPPPTTQIPWMGCDNIIVMCPTGPVDRYDYGSNYPRHRYDVPRDPGLPVPQFPYPPSYPPSYPPGHNPTPPIGFPPPPTSYIDVGGAPPTRTRVPRDPSLPVPTIPTYVPPTGNTPTFPPPGTAPTGTSYIDVSGIPSTRNRVPRDPNGTTPVFPTGGGTPPVVIMPPIGTAPPDSSTTDFVPVNRSPVRVPRNGF